jgi:hypothetical protein
MKIRNLLIFTILILVNYNLANSQENQISKTQLTDRPIESKLSYATWRTDYYICTGIAYAKSLGMTVNDFAVFVGNKHTITGPKDTSISAVLKTMYMVITTYPKGKLDLLSETSTSATFRNNRPYSYYFRNGPVLGVTIDEFESYLYGHVAIMTKRIGIEFKYDIKGDTVFGKIARYR